MEKIDAIIAPWKALLSSSKGTVVVITPPAPSTVSKEEDKTWPKLMAIKIKISHAVS
jgi:hypothetical protein